MLFIIRLFLLLYIDKLIVLLFCCSWYGLLVMRFRIERGINIFLGILLCIFSGGWNDIICVVSIYSGKLVGSCY